MTTKQSKQQLQQLQPLVNGQKSGLMNKRVCHFSGGRSSALATILAYRPGDLVVFCDTGREDPKTYKFINDFEAFTQIPVIRLQFEGGWERMLVKSRKAIPNYFKRFCTEELKVKTARRYLRSISWFQYEQIIGFRYDEPDRIKGYKQRWKKVKTIFPLNEAKIDKPKVLEYFKTQQFDLELPAILGNCDACFMKGEAAIIAIYADEPSKADKWIKDEEDPVNNPHGFTYLKGVTHRQMRDAALRLKKKYPLDEMLPKFTCACGS